MSGRQSSSVDKALSLIGKVRKGEVITAYRAAKLTGISLSTIYRAIARQKASTPAE
jgi:predicted DNA-binding transcriptional regulator YafY